MRRLTCIGLVGAVALLGVACGSKESRSGPMDTGVDGDEVTDGIPAPDAETTPSPDAGGQRDATAPVPMDAGPPPCGERELRCNGRCISEETPISGNCRLWAHVDAVSDMAVGDDGILYLGSYVQGLEGERQLHRVPAEGGAPMSLTDERYNIDHILLENDQLYFLTSSERSEVRSRLTGSIGRVQLPDGPVEVLVSDVPNGAFGKTESHFYAGAQQIDPGLRRFDLTGADEMLLTDAEIMDFRIVGDTAYLITSPFRSGPVMQMPLSGGEVTEFGGNGCAYVRGADADGVYARCGGQLTHIAFGDGTARPALPDEERSLVQEVQYGRYFYYVRSDGGFGRGPFELKRIALDTEEIEVLATLETDKFLSTIAPSDEAVYLFLDEGIRSLGFVLRIEVPRGDPSDGGPSE
jgi:hypothetical protein